MRAMRKESAVNVGEYDFDFACSFVHHSLPKNTLLREYTPCLVCYYCAQVYMEYPEFSKYQKVVDPKTLVNGYQDEEGNIFYVEPAFYYNLHGFKDKRVEAYEPILAKMEEIVKQFHHVIFTGNFEAPMYEKEGYIYKEIEDISDALGFFFEDKSRGSDYGD